MLTTAEQRCDPRNQPDAAWIAGMQTRFPLEPCVDRAMVRKLRIRQEPYHPLTLVSAKAQLDVFFEHTLTGSFEVSDIRLLSGGASKEQYAFRLQWSEDGRPRDERLVLRAQSAQSTVETDREREFQMLAAFADIVPAPKPYWVDNDAKFFQQPALIYSFCEGVVRPPENAGVQSVRGSFAPKLRALLLPQFVDYMARIAIFDPAGHDLSAFVVPAIDTTEAAMFAVNLCQRSWEEDRLEAIPLVTLAAQWLRDNAPPLDRVSVVHGDYRAGNYLFDPDSGRINAILDWECAHFGDRHEDLAIIMSPALCDTDEDGNLLVGGLCRREEFIARYEKATGWPVNPARLAYYEIFMLWRSVCVCMAGASRCIVGRKTHQDVVLAFITMVAGVMLGNLNEALLKEINRGA